MSAARWRDKKTQSQPLILFVGMLALSIGLCFRPGATGSASASQGQWGTGKASGTEHEHHSLVDSRWDWPSWRQVVRVLTLEDYNTRVVTLGTLILGTTSGVVGVFVLLRKRSLVGDVVGHASLPGIAVAFLVMEKIAPGGGKSLGGLLAGAAIAGLAGVACLTAILRYTRIKEDAALAMVLAVFFGLGIVLFTIIQDLPTGSSAGLNKFIFGTAASMVAGDVLLIAKAALVVLAVCALLYKELSLLCFDVEYATAQGWPTTWLDLALMAMVVAVAEIGAQSVGLILVVAMIIIPAAAARFWTENLLHMTFAAAALGGASAYLGVLASALVPRLAAGAIIVLVAGAFFAASMLLGAQRGLVWHAIAQRRLHKRVGRHDLMRAFYELLEATPPCPPLSKGGQGGVASVAFDRLLAMRSWSASRLHQLLHAARREGLVEADAHGRYRLTQRGEVLALRAARNHRLWEIYLIQYADIAPSHVDRDADQIEHVLDANLVSELESELAKQYPHMTMPRSPHAIEPVV